MEHYVRGWNGTLKALTGYALLWRGVVPVPRLVLVLVFPAPPPAVMAMSGVGDMDADKHVAVTWCPVVEGGREGSREGRETWL